MNSCVYLPKKGRKTFIELKNRYGYEKSAHIYNIVSRERFINEFKDSLEFDKDGMPTFESIMNNKLVRDYLTEETIIDSENKVQPHVEDTIDNTKLLINRADEYNKGHKDSIAVVDWDEKDNLTISILPRTSENEEIARNQKNILKVNETIVNMLSSVGITLGQLMEIEKGVGRVGITDFNNAKAIGEQFVNLIRVANNMEGFNAISEEFSHLLVRAFEGEPLMKRTIAYFFNEDRAREILGDEFDRVSDFYDGDSSMIAEEAAGKALQKAFLELSNKQPVKESLIKRLVNRIVSFFKGLSPSTLQNNLDNIDKDLSKFAQNIMSGNTKLTKEQIEKTKSNKMFNALSEKAQVQMDKLKEISRRFSKVSALRGNLTQLRKGEDTSQKAQAYDFYSKLKQVVNKGNKTEETVEAIYNVLQLSMSELKKVYNSIQNIEGLSVRDKFTVYRNCLDTAMAFAPTIKELKDLLTNEYIGDEQIAGQRFVVGDIENTLKKFEGVIDEIIDTSNMNTEAIAKTITTESGKWILANNEEYYINTETGAIAKRVTDIIQYTEDGEIFDENSPWVRPSTNIGTGVDNFVRDFFAGKLNELSKEELEKNYPNATGEDLMAFKRQLEELKKEFDDKGITIIPRNVTVNGTIETMDGNGKSHKIKVVGTLDLLGYDKDGNWHIYDMKTHRSKIKNATKQKYAKQLSLYKKFLEDKYGIKVKEMNVIPIKVSYPTPKGATTAEGKGTTVYKESRNNQLLIGNKEFRDAKPIKEDLIPIEEAPVKVEYSKLSENAEVRDGVKQTIETLHAVDDLYSAFMNTFSNETLEKFVEFLKPFVGESIMVRNKDGKMVKTTIEHIIKNSDSDVTLLQQWLTSMADNPDILLQMFDKVYKIKIHEKRSKVIDISQRIMALGKEYEAKGITNYDFMFEGDKRHYVTVEFNKDGVNVAYNKAAYEAAKKEQIKKLDTIYGKNPTLGSKEYKEKKNALKQWIKDNSILVEEENGFKHYVPSYKKFPSKYESFNETQKEFYDKWMELKEELDNNLDPKATTLFSTIKIRKSIMERSKDALMKGDFATFGKEIKSKFVRSYDDDIAYTEGIKGFNGEEILKLPTYYINENPNMDCSDLSTDVIGTLCAYAEMSLNYKAMSDIVNPLEIGRWLAYNVDGKGRIIKATQGGRQLVEKWKAGGRTTQSSLTVDVTQSNFKKTLDTFFDSKIYNRYLKDAGEIGGVDVNKAGSWLLKLGSTVQLGINALANLANVGTGMAMLNIEAASGEFFNAKELALADAAYTKELGSYFSDIGQRVQDSWLSLFDDMFDVRQNFSGKIKHKDWMNKTILTRIFGSGLQFIGQEMGDHWLYNRVALGIALRTKLKDNTTGKEISLRDALIRVPLNKNKPELGHKLVIKEGVTNLDGSAFTKEDIANISNKITYVNQHLFGIYNVEDAIAARQVIWGKFLMQYRDWIPTQFRYRFGAKTTNLMKGGIVEGYYRTTWTVGKELYNEVLTGEKTAKELWDDLEDWEKANIKRAVTEVSQFMILMAVITLMGKSKDKDRSWAARVLSYWAMREKTELAALVPSPFMLTEGIKLVKSPVANTSIWSDIANLQTCLWVPNWFDEIENGEYRGHSSGYRAFMRSPATLWYRNFKRNFNPEKAEQYYK